MSYAMPIARRVPIIGNTIYNAGQLIDVMMTPCNVDPWIAVKGFFNYTPYLVWSLLKPDPIDYVSERFGTAHKRKRKRKFHAIKVDPLAGQIWKEGWYAWRGVALTERIGWYLLVVDATTDFLVNWTSMAMTFSGCQVPNASWQYAKRTLNFAQDLFLLPGGSTVTSMNDRRGFPAIATVSTVKNQTGGAHMVTGSLRLLGLIGGATLNKIAIVDNNNRIVSAADNPAPPGTQFPINVNQVYREYNPLFSSNTYHQALFGSGGHARIAFQEMSCTDTLDPGFSFDP